jgi:hypothetical protein
MSNNNNTNNGGQRKNDTITSEQKLSALGLLGAVAAAFFLGNRIPIPYILVGSVGFGTGTSVSVGFYRVANLLKNGKAEKNKFGKGTLAGLAIFCSLMSFNAIPSIVWDLPNSDFFKGVNQNFMIPLLVASGVVGFFQNRANTLESIVDE